MCVLVVHPLLIEGVYTKFLEWGEDFPNFYARKQTLLISVASESRGEISKSRQLIPNPSDSESRNPEWNGEICISNKHL